MDFQNFQKPNFVCDKFLKTRSSKNLPWGHARSHKEFVRFGRFDVYWIQTNRQTSKVYIYRDVTNNNVANKF